MYDNTYIKNLSDITSMENVLVNLCKAMQEQAHNKKGKSGGKEKVKNAS